ncbi:MAG: SGNH/GDSL hydrolase family protein [Lachnospiraceae bacterium]|nr:SGNH/GDSL hydrolase family protein [Lachnospiraceae bacterium]
MQSQNKFRTAKKAAVVLVSLMVLLVILAGLQRLVQPKYAGDMPEGNFTAEYYEETADHDVLLIGDCEVYENIDPIYLWKNYGITSYIRGNAQQLAWQSYYMLEDALRYETPKVVIYNVQALTYGEPQREEYNRMALDGMRWSMTKYNAIQSSRCEGEKMLDYIFPLLRYHSRILDLSKEDLEYFWSRRKSTHNGYYMRIDVLPVSESDVADPSWLLGEEEETEEIDDPWADIAGAEEESEPVTEREQGEPFGHLPMEYLDRIRELCAENKIQLVLMKAPSLAPVWYESDEEQVVEYAKNYQLPYINFYEHLDETGIDYETDTYDGGLHMNLSGADKLSEYLGRVLAEEYGLADHRKDPAYAEIYREKEKFYEEMIQAQQKELDMYGEIRSF